MKSNAFLFFKKEKCMKRSRAAFEFFAGPDTVAPFHSFIDSPDSSNNSSVKAAPIHDTPHFMDQPAIRTSKRMKDEFPAGFHKATETIDVGSLLQPSKVLKRNGVNFNPKPTIQEKPKEAGLLGTENVAECFQTIFEFERFNRVQTECFHLVYETEHNAVISAPTGSGKTVLFELAICRMYKEFIEGRTIGSTPAAEIPRTIYIAPMKALCQERNADWRAKLQRLGLRVVELTGDTEDSMLGEVGRGHILLTTPEKWDTFTRRWKDHRKLVQGVRLLLIDEVHLLNTDRGATLEAVVARMQSIANLGGQRIRILAQSATIPNIEDLCEWLNVKVEIGLKRFGEEYRPIKLQKYVLGFPPAKNEFTFERALNFKLAGVIKQYSNKRPTLVFCQTQKGTVAAATKLKEDLESSFLIDSPQQRAYLAEGADRIKEKSLQNLVKVGIAYHHGSLATEDRHIIEELFRDGKRNLRYLNRKCIVKTICTTTTLSQGVNLPARLVVIKATCCYRGAALGYTEYSPIEIEQMMGRAGRIGLETEGIAVIMTERDKVGYYKDLTSYAAVVESTLSEEMAEHLNAEIALGTVTNISTAMQWVQSTFYYVRIKKNPKHYGFPVGVSELLLNQIVEKRLKGLIEKLARNGLVDYGAGGEGISSTVLGETMSKNYVDLDTMTLICQNPSNSSLKGILETLSKAKENEKFRSKNEERKLLSQINKSEDMRYQIEGSINTPDKKCLVLYQAAMSWIPIENWVLKKEQMELLANSWRILHCMEEFFLYTKNADGVINSINLCKGLEQSLWPDSPFILYQIPKIGEKLTKALADNGICSFRQALEKGPREIERCCSKNPPFGNHVIQCIESITTYHLSHSLKETLSEYELVIELTLLNQGKGKDFKTAYALVVSHYNKDKNVNELIDYKLIKEERNKKTRQLVVNFPVTVIGRITISFLCEKFVGLDQYLSIPDVEEAVGKKCVCQKDTPKIEFDAEEIDKLLELSENIKGNLKGRKAKPCNHKCKDKRKCKHMCCKQFLAEQEDPTQTTLSEAVKQKSEQGAKTQIKNNVSERLEMLHKYKYTKGKSPPEHESVTSEELAAIAVNELQSQHDEDDSGYFERLISVANEDFEEQQSEFTDENRFIPSTLLLDKSRQIIRPETELDIEYDMQEETTAIPPKDDENWHTEAKQVFSLTAKNEKQDCRQSFPEYFDLDN